MKISKEAEFGIIVFGAIIIGLFLENQGLRFQNGWLNFGLLGLLLVFVAVLVKGFQAWMVREDSVEKMFPGRPIYDLHRAAVEGDIQRMNKLIADGSGVNFKQSNGATPLHFAVQGGHSGAVKLLLDHSADVNAQGASGITPLVLAFTSGHFDVATVLVNHGATTQVSLDTGATALDVCILNRAPIEFVNLLLSHGMQVNVKDKAGVTPLHRCAMNGTVEVAALLIDHGAKVYVAESGGMTPLSSAAMCGNANVVAYLVSRGVDINHTAASGETPLHLAVMGGVDANFTRKMTQANIPVKKENVNHAEVARLLLGGGADANAKDNEERTPLYFAITGNSPGYIRILASSGAQLSKVHKAESALCVAVRLVKKEAVGCLIELGADVNEVVDSMSLLKSAQSKNNSEIATLLKNHGAT